MSTIKNFILLLSALPYLALAQTASNPFLAKSNQPIAFDKVTAANITEAVTQTIQSADVQIKAITTVPANKKTIANTLMAFDKLNYDLGDLNGKVYIVSATYADNDTRNTATAQLEKIQSYSTDLYLNEPLYQSLKQFSSLPQAKLLNATQQKFLRETLLNFEINGMKLSPDGRQLLKVINDKIIALGSQFDKNIAESKDSIEFSKAELQGVPDKTMAPWLRTNGKYMVRITGPNNNDVLRYADNETTRHTIFLHYYNRAYPSNIQVLDSLFYYRQQLADLLGFKTYAAYALVQKMAAKPSAVWNFLDDLRDKLTPGIKPELDDLTQVKHSLHPELPDTIMAWDVSYYRKKLFDTKYQLNTDEVKEYFEMNNTVKGMFTVYEKLFNLQIKEVNNLPLWDPKIKTFELFKEGQKMGTFYLDMYPRPNKYTHFETANISFYRKANGRELLPVGALICNFPEGTATESSLLPHSDVITLFHEFGHLIHYLLAHPVIASQNSFACKGDFVEAPSQFLENFCWEYDVLKLFARHYKTGAIMPRTLFDKMLSVKMVGVSVTNINQVYYASLDFTYEDRYASLQGKDINQVSRGLSAMTQIPFAEGSHFICNFTHLNGYGANYYGYLWSKVFAQDIFSVFQKNGVMNTATGVKYRKLILEKGATEEESDMLKAFLGREPNSQAFLKSLGIK